MMTLLATTRISCTSIACAPLHQRRCGNLSGVSRWLLSHGLDWLKGKHIVFIGSSISRYQYLNLAYHMLHREPPPFDMTDSGLEMMDQMNVTRPPKAGDYEGYWATFYRASNLCLNANGRGGREVCDCYRGWGKSDHVRERDVLSPLLKDEAKMHNVDMRYALDADGRTALTYVQWFMDEVAFRGHYHPDVHGPVPHTNCSAGTCGPPYSWEYLGAPTKQLEHQNSSLGEPLMRVLHEVVLRLQPSPTHIVLGAPWPGGVNGASWLSALRTRHLLEEGDAIMCKACAHAEQRVTQFVWKMHTQVDRGSHHMREKVASGMTKLNYASLVNEHPAWLTFDLWNVTEPFGHECFNDAFHYNELARTHFNELLLRLLVSADHNNGGERERHLCKRCKALVNAHTSSGARPAGVPPRKYPDK